MKYQAPVDHTAHHPHAHFDPASAVRELYARDDRESFSPPASYQHEDSYASQSRIASGRFTDTISNHTNLSKSRAFYNNHGSSDNVSAHGKVPSSSSRSRSRSKVSSSRRSREPHVQVAKAAPLPGGYKRGFSDDKSTFTF